MRAVAGEDVRWSDAEHLLARVVDELSELNWRYTVVHGVDKGGKGYFPKGAQTPPPKPLRRPGDPAPEQHQRPSVREGLQQLLATKNT